MVSDPLRLLEICTTSDGGAAVVVSSLDYAKSIGVSDPVRISAIALNTPTYPDPLIDLPYLATDSSASTLPSETGFKQYASIRSFQPFDMRKLYQRPFQILHYTII